MQKFNILIFLWSYRVAFRFLQTWCRSLRRNTFIPSSSKNPICIIFPVLVRLLLYHGVILLVMSPDPIAVFLWMGVTTCMTLVCSMQAQYLKERMWDCTSGFTSNVLVDARAGLTRPDRLIEHILFGMINCIRGLWCVCGVS